MKPSFSTYRVLINGMRSLALTKKQAIAVLGSGKLVDRMLLATRHANGRLLVLIHEDPEFARRNNRSAAIRQNEKLPLVGNSSAD